MGRRLRKWRDGWKVLLMSPLRRRCTTLTTGWAARTTNRHGAADEEANRVSLHQYGKTSEWMGAEILLGSRQSPCRIRAGSGSVAVLVYGAVTSSLVWSVRVRRCLQCMATTIALCICPRRTSFSGYSLNWGLKAAVWFGAG